MRTLAVVLALVFALSGVSVLAEPGVFLPCSWLPGAGPLDTSCVAPIHPGARSSACTLNWIVTDGTDLYVGAAKHCVGDLGQRLSVEGAPGTVATLVHRGHNDSAFFRIDAEHRALVSGSLEGWGGPTGVQRDITPPGMPAVVFGHGYVTEPYRPLHGRPMDVVYHYPTHSLTILVGAVSGGDSGSPVMLADGKALGIAVAAGIFPPNPACEVEPAACVGTPSQIVFAVPLSTELPNFERTLGKPVTLVTGRPTLTW